MLNNKHKIKIAIQEMSNQNVAILTFYFTTVAYEYYTIVDDDKADVLIFDYDYPGANEALAQAQETTQCPAIIFSIEKTDLPNTLSLSSPLSAIELTAAVPKLNIVLSHKAVEQTVKPEFLLGEMDFDNDFEATNSITSDSSETDSEVDDLLESLNTEAESDPLTDNNKSDTSHTKDEHDFENDLVDITTLEAAPKVTTELKTKELAPAALETTHIEILEFEAEPSGSLSSTSVASAEPNNDLSIENDAFIDLLTPKTADSEASSLNASNENRVHIEIEAEDNDLEAASNEESENDLSEESTTENDFFDLSLLNEIETKAPDSDTSRKKANFGALEVNTVFDGASLVEDSSDGDLQSLLNEVREEAHEDDDLEFGSDSNEKTEAEIRWDILCGDNADISEQKDVFNISFNRNKHLLDVLINEIQLVRDDEQVFRMKLAELIIVINKSKNSIYCNLPITSEIYSEICFEELDPSKIKTYDLDYSEVRLYEQQMEESPENVHSIESFVWTTSLLTSRGRLPNNTDINKKVEFTVWPDLTAVESIPHAEDIAETLSKKSGNLLIVADYLDIPQRYVFAFYNAALSLEMTKTAVNEEIPEALNFDDAYPVGTETETEAKGLLGRLFKR